jgi:serine/threonine-protein kinase
MAGLEGTQLGDCEILAKLGQGGMGAVYKAKQTALDRFVAIKVLPPQFSDDEDFLARFKREAAAAARLTHPNIVQVYSAGKQADTHYFVMEFVDGESVQQRILRKGKIAPAEALAICVYVAQGLDYAWKRNKLIHRDIKPDNMFLSADGEVKIGDLGLAKSANAAGSGLTISGSSMGTPYFTSPEQARGLPDIDFRADIYSLGCSLYFMVSGHMPYESAGCNPLQIMFKHVSEPPPDVLQVWPQCPQVLAALIAKMVQKKPEDRFQSYEELLAEIKTVSAELHNWKPHVVVPVSPAANWPKPLTPGTPEKKPPSKSPPPPEKKASANATPPEKKQTPKAAPAKVAKPPQTTPVLPKPPAVEPRETPFGLIMIGTAVVSLLALGVFLWAPWKSRDAATPPAVARPPAAPGVEAGALKLWDAPDKIPAQAGVRWENSALLLGHSGMAGLLCYSLRTSCDTAIRAEVLMNPDAAKVQLMVLRNNLEGTCYRLVLAHDKVDLKSVYRDKETLLCSWPLPRTYGPAEWMQLELRVIGDKIGAIADGHLLGTTQDASLSGPGGVGLYAQSQGYFRSIVYVSLDKPGSGAAPRPAAPQSDAAFVQEVAALPPEQQVARVVARLQDLNLDYTGKESHQIENGAVVELRLDAESIRRLAPVAALRKLQRLHLTATRDRQAALADVSALAGLQLTVLDCNSTQVADLSPLRGQPLEDLNVRACHKLTSLEPLKGMKLRRLNISNNMALSDFSALQGMPLESFEFIQTRMRDLEVVRGAPLQRVRFFMTEVRDLSPLRGAPLKDYEGDAGLLSDPQNLDVLRSVKTLERIQGKPAAEFWKQVEAGQMPGADQAQAVSAAPAPTNPVPRRAKSARISAVDRAPEANEAAWQNSVSLLPLIEPERDTVRGEWVRDFDKLVGDRDAFATIEIPYRPPEEYDYRVEFTPAKHGNIGALHLAKAEHAFTFTFFGAGGALFGFESVKGDPLQGNPTAKRMVPVEAGKRYVVLVEVRNSEVRAFLNACFVTAWKTDYSDLQASERWKLRDAALLGLGCQSHVEFHSARIREVTGKGTFLRQPPPAATAPGVRIKQD